MPRLTNQSGVIVSCSDDTAALLGTNWQVVAADNGKPASEKSRKSASADTAKR